MTVTNLWEKLTYTVTEISIIQPHEVDKIKVVGGSGLWCIAQNCLQTPADLKSAGNRGVIQSRLQMLHVHVLLVAPLGARHVA